VSDDDARAFLKRIGDGQTPEEGIIPAATVVLVRDGDDGLETLMLRKSRGIAFGGMWVFPGGRVDEVDWEGVAEGDDEVAARRAAVREAAEECGLAIEPGDLAWFSHWLPPRGAPKRYATYFFVAPTPEGEVAIDQGEINESAWMAPSDALARRDGGEIELAPPTWVTLHLLDQFASVADLRAHAHATDPVFYATRIADHDGTLVAMWAGDAGYEAGDPSAEGARHRLLMADAGWTLDRTE
jgi:8-oxo-dGTP pyrophosphatase MutT (NUDIX family)